jgi:hypothetical protein
MPGSPAAIRSASLRLYSSSLRAQPLDEPGAARWTHLTGAPAFSRYRTAHNDPHASFGPSDIIVIYGGYHRFSSELEPERVVPENENDPDSTWHRADPQDRRLEESEADLRRKLKAIELSMAQRDAPTKSHKNTQAAASTQQETTTSTPQDVPANNTGKNTAPTNGDGSGKKKKGKAAPPPQQVDGAAQQQPSPKTKSTPFPAAAKAALASSTNMPMHTDDQDPDHEAPTDVTEGFSGSCSFQGCHYGKVTPAPRVKLLEHVKRNHQGGCPFSAAELKVMGLIRCEECTKVAIDNGSHTSPCIEERYRVAKQQEAKDCVDLAIKFGLEFDLHSHDVLAMSMNEILSIPVATFDLNTRNHRLILAFKLILSDVIKKSVDPSLPVDTRDRARRFTYLLPGWIFNFPPTRKEGETYTQIFTQRLKLLCNGDIYALEKGRQESLTALKSRKASDTDVYKQIKSRNTRAERKLFKGELSRAMSALESNGRTVFMEDSSDIEGRVKAKLIEDPHYAPDAALVKEAPIKFVQVRDKHDATMTGFALVNGVHVPRSIATSVPVLEVAATTTTTVDTSASHLAPPTTTTTTLPSRDAVQGESEDAVVSQALTPVPEEETQATALDEATSDVTQGTSAPTTIQPPLQIVAPAATTEAQSKVVEVENGMDVEALLDVAAVTSPAPSMLVDTPLTTSLPQPALKSQVDASADPIAFFSEEDLQNVVSTLSDSSGGPSGWTNHLVMKFFDTPDMIKLLHQHLFDLLTGPDDHLDLVFLRTAGSLTLIAKDATNVRPIGCREAFSRLLARCICLQDQADLCSELLPEQFGVGAKRGMETAVHSGRLVAEAFPNWIAVQVDISNAFGSVNRAAIAAAIARLPLNKSGMARRYHNLFVVPPTLNITSTGKAVTANRGVVQGDPLSPWFFCLAISRALKNLTEFLGNKGYVTAYLDDVRIQGEPDVVPQAVFRLSQELKDLGMDINPNKTVWIGNALHQAALSAAVEQLGFPSAKLVPSAKFLGTQIGIDQVAEAEATREAKGSTASWPIKELIQFDNKQGRMLLLKVCLAAKMSTITRLGVRDQSDIDDMYNKLLGVFCSILDVGTPSDNITLTLFLPHTSGGFGIPDPLELQHISYTVSLIQAYQGMSSVMPKEVHKVATKTLQNASSRSHKILTKGLHAINERLNEAQKAKLMLADLQVAKDNMSKLTRVKHSRPKAPALIPASGQSSAAKPYVPTSVKDALGWQIPKSTQATYLDWCAVARLAYLYKHIGIDPRERARILDRCQDNSAGFLQAIPTDRRMVIENKNFTVLMRAWIGEQVAEYLGVPKGTPCPCEGTKRAVGKGATPNIIPQPCDDDHTLHCNLGKYEAHKFLAHAVKEMANEAGIKADLEVLVSHPSLNANSEPSPHRLDVVWTLGSQEFGADVTVVSALTGLSLRSSETPLDACQRAISTKEKLYLPLMRPGQAFIAAPVTSFGAMHPNMIKIIDLFSPYALHKAPESAAYNARSFRTYWKQRISVGCANAVAKRHIDSAEKALAALGIQRC